MKTINTILNIVKNEEPALGFRSLIQAGRNETPEEIRSRFLRMVSPSSQRYAPLSPEDQDLKQQSTSMEVKVINTLRELVQIELFKEEFTGLRGPYCRLPLTSLLHLFKKGQNGTNYKSALTSLFSIFATGEETEDLDLILMCDPLTLLLFYSFHPFPAPKKVFTQIVKMCYNLCLLKNMVSIITSKGTIHILNIVGW